MTSDNNDDIYFRVKAKMKIISCTLLSTLETLGIGMFEYGYKKS